MASSVDILNASGFDLLPALAAENADEAPHRGQLYHPLLVGSSHGALLFRARATAPDQSLSKISAPE